MNAKQLRIDWDRPKADVKYDSHSDGSWSEMCPRLIDDDLPENVLEVVNNFLWACWLTECVPDSFANELLLKDVKESIARWTQYADKKLVEEVQHAR